jgi:hypothetical protein
MIAPLLLASLSTAAPAARHEIHLPPRDTLAPPRRAHHALAYDETGRRVLLTGGSTPHDGGQRFEVFNDLWAFDGTRWTQLPSSGAKSSGSRLAWDRKRNLMVSFGGHDGRALPDLRVLEGNTWRTIGQHIEMPAAEPGFIYDSRRNRFVAFGGSAAPGWPHGDTWELDGESWKRVATLSPPARQAHAMVYDERRGQTVVFGGMGPGEPGRPPPALGDTWEFDGKSWTERRVTGPGARHGAGVAYDSKRGMVILFGGLTSEGFKGDTWSWNGVEWRKLAESGPEPRGMGYLAYDQHRDRVVLFGGRKGWPDGDLNDTWEWDGAGWRRFGG